MSDAADDSPITEPPALPLRLRLVAAMAGRAAELLEAANLLGRPPVETETEDSKALATLAAQCRQAAEAAREAAAPPDKSGERVAALPALAAELQEALAHMKAAGAVTVADSLDPAALRRVDLAALADAAPALLVAAAARKSGLAIEAGEGADGIVLRVAGGDAAVPLAAPRIEPAEEESGAIPLFDPEEEEEEAAKPAAAPKPKPRGATVVRDDAAPVTPVDAPWMAVIERSPTARMILEDIARTLPLAAQIAAQVDQIREDSVIHPELRAVIFDPGERGMDWRAELKRFTDAARQRPLKAVAMTRCSTAQAETYREAGFDMVIEKPVSPQSFSKMVRDVSG